MTVVGVAATTLTCGLLGATIGFWMGLAEGGDFNLAPAFYAPLGGCIGLFGGAVLGAVAFL